MAKILIAGVPRAGKSILARRVSRELGMSHLPVDSLVSTMGALCPEQAISHTNEDHRQACKQLKRFLVELFRHIRYEQIAIVADLYHVLPEDIVEMIDGSGDTAVFMGYCRVDPSEKCMQIRCRARKEDWTERLSDAQLRDLVERFTAESVILRDECTKAGISFFDTGADFDRTLDLAFRELAARDR